MARCLAALPEVQRASRVALYAATDDELPTRESFEALARLGCRRLLPRIVGEGLEFAAVERFDELVSGRFGVLAPPADRPAERLGPGDLVLVPGVAFAPDGQRLGRGGGYYDRAFSASPPLRIGLAFELQCVEHVPHDSRDRPVDAIVTERRVRWATRSKAGTR